jgi:hypothetical protein
MDLLERYLQAVKKYLPWQRQDDILAELRANLESQLEDQEAEIGRPLNNAEMERWLKQLGSPMQVAGRYQPQQYLIGPTVFPTYWYVMRLAIFWMLAVYAIVIAVQIFSAPDPTFSAVVRAALRVPGVMIATAAWVTLIFAVLEYTMTHYPGKWPATANVLAEWSPGSLPPLERGAIGRKKPRSFATAVAEVVFGIIFLIWLLMVPGHPVLMFGPGEQYMHLSPFQLQPVWWQFYWWAVALNICQLGWHLLDLVHGNWQGERVAQRIAAKLLGLIPLVVLIEAPDQLLVTLKNPAADLARYGSTENSINDGIHRALLVVCAIVVLQVVWEIGQASLASYRKRQAARP